MPLTVSPIWMQGDCEAVVERRSGGAGRFGLGFKENMRFSVFLLALQQGNTDLYLTPQKVVLICKYRLQGRWILG